MSPQEPTSCNTPDGAVSSCVFVNDTIAGMLDQTLRVWGRNYEFRVFTIGQDPAIHIKKGQCLRDRDSHTISIPQESGVGVPISVRIDVC